MSFVFESHAHCGEQRACCLHEDIMNTHEILLDNLTVLCRRKQHKTTKCDNKINYNISKLSNKANIELFMAQCMLGRWLMDQNHMNPACLLHPLAHLKEEYFIRNIKILRDIDVFRKAVVRTLTF